MMFEQNDNRILAELNRVNVIIPTAEQKSKPDFLILNPTGQKITTTRVEISGLEPGDSVEIVEVSPLGNINSLQTFLADGIYNANILTLLPSFSVIAVQWTLSNPEGTLIGIYTD